MIQQFANGYDFLNNFWPVPITWEGLVYPSVENAFQAAKFVGRNPQETNVARQGSGFLDFSPAEAKKWGHTLFLRPDWEQVKDEIMYQLVRQKFTNDAQRKALLLSTGSEYLIEGNQEHDNYWGSCTCNLCKHLPGRNQLGEILMRVRKELQDIPWEPAKIRDETGWLTRWCRPSVDHNPNIASGRSKCNQ